MVGIVIVSHSWKIAEGIKDLALQVCAGSGNVFSAGGMEDGEIGTDAFAIAKAIQEADKGDGVAILADLGSAIMSVETALELLEDETGGARLADAPIVEGAIAAAVEAASGSSLSEVIQAAEEAWGMRKV